MTSNPDDHYRSVCIRQWPPLAWVAKLSPSKSLHLWHGVRVERRKSWFGELCWDGDFEAGNIASGEHVFGSGGQHTDDGWTFVSSSTVLDRLHHFCEPSLAEETPVPSGRTDYVSNSLVALAAVAGLSPMVSGTHYPKRFKTICRGLSEYDREIPMDRGPVHLTYMENLRWRQGRFKRIPKNVGTRRLDCFEDYHREMVSVLNRLAGNWSAKERCFQYEPIASLSTGYDSPAASVLGKEVGLTDSITITSGRSGDQDDGATIADHLGLQVSRLDRDQWRRSPLSEVTYLAGDGKGEDVYFAPAAGELSGRVLLTGYGGNRVWGAKPSLSNRFERSDQSGLSHTEARLHQGYLHLPVPFLVAHQTADLRRITHSSPMSGWHVGREYNSPIARRIIEEAGVPREAFGVTKKAASILMYDSSSSLSDEGDASFQRWQARRLPRFDQIQLHVQRYFYRGRGFAIRAMQQFAGAMGRVIPIRVLGRIAGSSRLSEMAGYEAHFRYLFPWASETLIGQYRQTWLAARSPDRLHEE
ncbi:MAG: hypothetical protein AAF670_00375 [Planctomycetota bacterium]